MAAGYCTEAGRFNARRMCSLWRFTGRVANHETLPCTGDVCAEKTAQGGSNDPLFVRLNFGRGGLFFNQIIMKTEIMIPIRSAERQFAAAAANSCLLRVREADGLYEVDGVGGKCLMEPADYEQYKRLCAEVAAVPRDLQAAPGVSMLEATAEEETEMELLARRHRSHFAESFREIERLLLSYPRSMSEEDRDDIITTLCTKILPLREAVLRAE